MTDAERTMGQRAAVVALGRLLTMQATRGLPPCTWTITPDGALTAHCPGLPASSREQDFRAWMEALGYPGSLQREVPSPGLLRLRAAWGSWHGVALTLIADVTEGERP